MIVAIHQPNYAPWLGYFYKIARSDVFVFLDNVQFSKNSYTNRAKILANGQSRWLSLPISAQFGDPIHAVRPAVADWASRHLDTLKTCYHNAHAFQTVWPAVRQIYESASGADLATINVHFLRAISDALDFQTHFVRSSDIDTGFVAGDDRLIALVLAIDPNGIYLSGRGGAAYQNEAKFSAAGLSLVYTDFIHPTYRQTACAFVPGLSVLDSIFHGGFAATRNLILGARGGEGDVP